MIHNLAFAAAVCHVGGRSPSPGDQVNSMAAIVMTIMYQMGGQLPRDHAVISALRAQVATLTKERNAAKKARETPAQ
jgi:hypothetical protein